MLRRTPDGPDLGFYEITRRDGASSITLHTADVASNCWDAAEIAIPEAGESRSLQHPAGNFRSNA